MTLDPKKEYGQINGYILCIIPEEYIHWGGFVISFLLVVIALVFLHSDGVVSTGEMTPTVYIDLVMLFSSMLMCARCLYLYTKAWFVSHSEGDDDDDSTSSPSQLGSTKSSNTEFKLNV